MPRYASSLFHPLDWPTGYPRTESPSTARFRQTFAASRQHLEKQIDHFGGTSIIISSDWPLSGTGTLKATTRQPEDTGVSVFFTRDGKEVCMACDAWDCVEDNLRAIGLTLEALRGIDRWSVSEIIGRIFAGFMALPASASVMDGMPWWEFLGVEKNARKEQVKVAINKKRFELHPDQNGGLTVPGWYKLQEIVKEIGL